jgi:protease-4
VFIDHVAEGRGMTKADVDSIGQGRVWSGEDALELGLIDVLGGLEDAIEIAAEMAGLEEYRIKELPKQKDPFEEILAELTGAVRLSMMKYELGDSYIYYEQLKKLTRMKGIQMIVPYSLELN